MARGSQGRLQVSEGRLEVCLLEGQETTTDSGSCFPTLTTDYKPYHYDMGESENTFKIDNTSILYIYKVFKHIPMQWMAIWMHP